jgi:glycosyltransferase involved in cell wall biosynthesis
VHVVVSCLGSVSGGGAVVARAAVAALCAHDAVARVRVLCSPGLTLDPHPALEPVPLPRQTRSYAARVAFWSYGLARAAARADAVVCMNGVGEAPGRPRVNMLQQPHVMRPPWHAPRGMRLKVAALRALSRASCARADAVVTQTHAMARAATRALDLDPARVHVLTPASGWGEEALGSWAPPPGGPRRVLCVASQLSSKRVDVAARACDRLGAGVELRVTWPAEAARALGARARGLGALGRDQVAAEMARAHALVMPSEVESLGLPLVEAMGVGLPVVAADVPYAREVCGEAGVYFRPGDPVDAARAIARALRAPEAYSAAGRARHDALARQDAYGAFAQLVVDTARAGRSS